VPLYEYQCKKCKHRFEKIQKFSDPPVRKCPECGGGVEKLLSMPAVQFKGTGWYVTDYARKSGASNSSDSSATSSSSDGAKDGSGSSSKSDKAETKKPEKKAAKK
jgi:putative FmdB family regulatory protein